MISIIDLLLLCWVHFFSDFVLQTRKQAESKSSDNTQLFYHVSIYSIPFLIFGFYFAIVTGILHFITDYFSSKASKKAYEENNIKKFWIVIGADQSLHFSALFLVFYFLGSPIYR